MPAHTASPSAAATSTALPRSDERWDNLLGFIPAASLRLGG